MLSYLRVSLVLTYCTTASQHHTQGDCNLHQLISQPVHATCIIVARTGNYYIRANLSKDARLTRAV
jgi:hypothetical protein